MADALFVLAMTLSISSTARSCAVPEAMPRPRAMNMNDIAELFQLTRGAREIMKATQDHVREGPMAALFRDTTYPADVEVELPDAVSAQLAALHQMVAASVLSSDDLTHCQSAVQSLEHIYQNVKYWAKCSRVEIGHVWQWQVRIPTDYIRLIQARSPTAIVILACYAAAVSAIQQAWFTQNWAEYAIRGIREELPPSMQHWIEWPAQQVHKNMAILGVTMPESDDKSAKAFIGF